MECSGVLVLLSLFVGLACGFLTDADWDYFTFSQAWPPGTCVAGIFQRHTCSVPPNVTTWTIHGLCICVMCNGFNSSLKGVDDIRDSGVVMLTGRQAYLNVWPSSHDTKGPTFCDHDKPFDIGKLVSLRGKMEAYWPNLYNDTSHDSFWEHEWTKHGTCCLDLPATSSQEGYFEKGLELNQMYNMSEMLRKGGVVPSTSTQYKYTDFMNAIKKATGYEPVIMCAYTKLANGTGYHLIDQIDICLDKQFKPISCYTKSGSLRRSLSQIRNQELVSDTAGPLRYRSSQHVYEPHSDCPTHYSFNYPPIQHF